MEVNDVLGDCYASQAKVDKVVYRLVLATDPTGRVEEAGHGVVTLRLVDVAFATLEKHALETGSAQLGILEFEACHVRTDPQSSNYRGLARRPGWPLENPSQPAFACWATL